MTEDRLAEIEKQNRTYGVGPGTVKKLIDEIRQLQRDLDAAQLRSIEARNPGIDMEEVKRLRAND